MKITINLSREARVEYDPNAKGHGMGYMGSRFLADSFVRRGHEVTIVHPTDLSYDKLGNVYAKKTYGLLDNNFFPKKNNQLLEGDVFFVYSLNEEEGIENSKIFMDSLYQIEKQFDFMLNTAESTSYESKPKQKKLNLPWIPGFDIRNHKELSDLLSMGEKIIAKPVVGACGQGIRYLEKQEDIKMITDVNQYLFEKYIESNEERRYVFLDNECILKRKMRKEGLPGNEICTNVTLTEGNTQELEIARRAINEIGMFYAAVDFRGDYLLEINGSGTGVAPPTVANEIDCYNLSNPIVQAVEKIIKSR